MAQEKIALVQMPLWATDFPPLALAMVASALKRKQVEVKCFDFNKELDKEQRLAFQKEETLLLKAMLNLLFPEYYPPFDEKLKNLASRLDVFIDSCSDKLTMFKPDIVAFSVCAYTMQVFCLLLAKKIKKTHPGINVVFGGLVYAKGLDNDLPLKTGFVDELVFKGEEDKFFEKFEDKKNCDFDPEIVYFDSFDLKNYKPVLPMLWTEGCNMGCKFCIHHSIGGAHETFDINKLIKQIKFYIKEYKTNTFYLSDSNTNQNPKFLSEICDRIIEEKLNISWTARFYIYSNMKTDLLKKIAEAGCERVSIGMESGSQKILDKLNKKFTVETAKEAIKNLHDCGIKVSLYLIIGSPSETHKDYWETIRLLFEIGENIEAVLRVYIFHYQKGSPFYSEIIKNGAIKTKFLPALKKYEKYFPYAFYPKPASNTSTINDRKYLRNVTFHIFDANFRIKYHKGAASEHFIPKFKMKNHLVIDKVYYDGSKVIGLNNDGGVQTRDYYYYNLPRDIDQLNYTTKALKKRIRIILNIDYEHYFDKKGELIECLNKLGGIEELKLCRPIPSCLMSEELIVKEGLKKRCKHCIAYLYLNKDEKILYCRKKFWDYYTKSNNRMNETCKNCSHQKNGRCKMYCIQYLANKPL